MHLYSFFVKINLKMIFSNFFEIKYMHLRIYKSSRIDLNIDSQFLILLFLIKIQIFVSIKNKTHHIKYVSKKRMIMRIILSMANNNEKKIEKKENKNENRK